MILPSGRVIDLSTNRSKYHALRQGDVRQNFDHRKLYPLVDIIYRQLSEPGKPKTGWTEYDYNYSGYALDSVRFAKDWTEEDKTILAEWIQQETQRRIIDLEVPVLFVNEALRQKISENGLPMFGYTIQ